MFIFHSRPNQTIKKRVTLVGGYNEQARRLQLAASICSPKDQFNRKRGVKIATGRYAAGKFVVDMPVETEPSGADILQIATTLLPSL